MDICNLVEMFESGSAISYLDTLFIATIPTGLESARMISARQVFRKGEEQ